MDLSALFKNCRLYSADLSSEELIGEKVPAVYAFYESFKFEHTDLIPSIDEYKSLHSRHVRMDASRWPLKLDLTFKGNPIPFKGTGKNCCKKIGLKRAINLAGQLQFLSILNEPLYIGKTEDLKGRFKAHHDNGFIFKMKNEYKRTAKEFVILAFQCDKADVRILESILIQIINPPYCEQKS